MLYTVLMDERHGPRLPEAAFDSPSILTKSGLLFYTQSEEIIRVPVSRNELRGLMITRNELANYLTRRLRMRMDTTSGSGQTGDSCSFLPPTIDQERACSRCYVADACMLYRKVGDRLSIRMTGRVLSQICRAGYREHPRYGFAYS